MPGVGQYSRLSGKSENESNNSREHGCKGDRGLGWGRRKNQECRVNEDEHHRPEDSDRDTELRMTAHKATMRCEVCDFKRNRELQEGRRITMRSYSGTWRAAWIHAISADFAGCAWLIVVAQLSLYIHPLTTRTKSLVFPDRCGLYAFEQPQTPVAETGEQTRAS